MNIHPAGAQLSHAELSHAELSHAELSHAELSHAELSHAELSHAEFSHADALLRHASSGTVLHVWLPFYVIYPINNYSERIRDISVN